MGEPLSEKNDHSKDTTATESNIRFAVTTYPNSVETDEFTDENTTHCSSTAGNSIGYSTHEAVPMTVFYRNASSRGPGKAKGKARPTLDQLRKGFEKGSNEEV